MSGQTIQVVRSFIADSTSIGLWRVVVQGSAANHCTVPAGLHAQPLGVAQAVPRATGQAIPVLLTGIARCVGKGVINVGDAVEVNSNTGDVVSITPATGTNVRWLVGEALTAGAADGDWVYVRLAPQVYIGA
jgi:hypothetical protein